MPSLRAARMLSGQEPVAIDHAAERRTMRRFDMRLPAAIRSIGGAEELLTETQNVSARGVFFYLDRPLAEGSKIEVTTTFPPHITMTGAMRVRFTARVVRVEAMPASRVGVAAVIEEYEFLPTAAPGIPAQMQ